MEPPGGRRAALTTARVFRREVLRLSDSLDELGPISWKLALCLAAIWLICYFCVWKGVKSTGKVSAGVDPPRGGRF